MPMDPERKAFIDAIRANPDDDNVRLVYADWLQERGEDDRAEVIRSRIDYKNAVLSGANRYERNPHWDRMTEYQEWFWRHVGIKLDQGMNAKADRGFLKDIYCPWQWWLDNSDRLLETEWVPLIRLPTEPALIRSHSQRKCESDPFVQIVTMKVRSARGPGNKVAQCEHAISEREMQTAKYNVMDIALECLNHKMSTKACLKLWWPDTEFEWPGSLSMG